MPYHSVTSAFPVRFDRPPSPADRSSASTLSKTIQTNQSSGKRSTEERTVSPDLPANPPPTPEISPMIQSSRFAQISLERSGNPEFPPSPPQSPPPSPPPDIGSTCDTPPFRFLEAFMSSKRQAATVHGECSLCGHIARADNRLRNVDTADHL